MTFLIDANHRIAKIYRDFDPTTHAFELVRHVEEMFCREPVRQVLAQAPVLLIPNVLPPEFCAELIDLWESEGNVDSGFMRQVGDKTVGVYDYGHKIRRDHFMKESPALAQLKRLVRHRVLPEITRAFNYEVTRFEDFRIACYDAARGGYFRPHCDNTTAGTAHRRFAMSLFLNEDYQGGSLRFPEYAPHLYRTAAGSAVIFSCSLLHEATDVTAGRRFVLRSFFYGEREARIREEYNRRTGGEYRASNGSRPGAHSDVHL